VDDQESSQDVDAALDEWLRYDVAEDDRKRRHWDWLDWLALALAIVTVVGIVLLWPTGRATSQFDAEALSTIGVPSQFYAADVTRVEQAQCEGSDSDTCTTVDFALVAGPDVGYVYTQVFPEGPTTPSFSVGERAILSYLPANASISAMQDQACSFDAEQTCKLLSLVVGEGKDAEYVDYELSPDQDDGSFFVGAPVMAQFVEGDGGQPEIFGVSPESPRLQYSFADFQRRPLLAVLVLLFAAVVVWLGRWRGTAALGGLVASVAILLLFVLPAILDGRSPVLVAVFGSAGIAYVALYMAQGFNRMTTVALIGTVATLLMIALMSAAVVAVAHFTGLVSEESSLLTYFNSIDVRGLLLAGIVLGAAGAINDVTVTQASAVWELRAANPSMHTSELFHSGLRIGRDHIASMVNTLLLAYAGAALPLVVLFVLSQQSLGSVANSEVVAVEIVRTLVGSIGLVAAVPLTTWLAALSAGDELVPVHHH
jgi:uncharacterized membrane protein